MSYKKFIKRGDKTYGPYSYKSVKVNGKVTTEYLGKFKVPREKGFLKFLIPVVALLFLGLFFILNNFNLTGNVSMDLQDVYYSGEDINGNLKINLEQGELLPASTKVIINNSGEIREYVLSELISSENLVNGNFYLVEKNLSGIGDGFGLAGERVSYPDVNFVLKILELNEEIILPENSNKTEIVNETLESNVNLNVSSSGEGESQEVSEVENITEENFQNASSNTSSNSSLLGEESSSLITGEIISESQELIEGITSKHFPFHYNIGENKNVEIVSSDQEINLDIKNGWVDVETNYEQTENGFGEDYLGKGGIQLDIDLSQLDLIAKEGELSVKLVYDNSEIISLNKNIKVFSNETILEKIIENNSLINTTQYGAVINKPVKWKKIVTLNETNESISVELPKEAENISVYKILGEENNIIETTEITEQVSNENINILTGHISAELNLENENNFKNFFKKIFGSITGKSVDVEETEEITQVTIENENSNQIEIVYETPGPVSNETNTFYGKEIVISSEIHYQNILAYTELNEPTDLSWIKLYQIDENGNRILTQFNAYDYEGNEIKTKIEDVNKSYNFSITDVINETNVANSVDTNLVSYIEWIVPHLSEQKYELIIVISGAEHLDESKNFIEDIYSETNSLDGNWSGEIKSNEYVRVTFEKPLSNKNDITVYAKSSGYSNASLEVYEKDSNSKIASINDISSEGFYKTYLTNLGENENYITFDLKIINSSVWFDYIVDPILLNSSVGIGTNTTTEVNFTHLSLTDPTLLLYMPFDVNSSTKTYDYTNNTYVQEGFLGNGTAGTQPTWEEGYIGGSYKTNITQGKTQCILNTKPVIVNNFTLSFWYRPYNLTGVSDVVSLGAAGTGNFEVFRSNGAIYFRIRNSTDMETLGASGVLSNDVWQQLTFVYNGTHKIIYINNVQRGIAEKTGALGNTTNLYLGIGASPNGCSANGDYAYFDEVKIFNRSLSSTEVAQLYNSTYPIFYPYGEQTFTNIDFQSNSTILNLSVQECQQLNGTYLQGTINGGEFQNFSNCSLNNLNITQQFNNLTIKYLSNSYNSYSPLVLGNITLTFDSNFTSCGNLTSANQVYNLNNNVTSAGTCFNIQAPNITLDCQNNWINYSTSGTESTYGVYSNQFNSTVKNCNIVDGNFSNADNTRFGIYFVGATNGTIFNNILNTSAISLHTLNGLNNNISSNKVNAAVGNSIRLQTSSNNTLAYNDASCPNNYAIRLDISSNSNILIGNNGTSVGYSGFFLLSSNYNTLINNTGISNSNAGIYIYLSNNNNLSTNFAKSLGAYALIIRDSNNSILTNNTGHAPTNFGIYLYSNSNNNTLISNNATGLYGYYIRLSSANNLIKDCYYTSGSTSDVYVHADAGSTNNTFLNCSYNLAKESVNGAGNELIRKWYYQTYVNYSNGIVGSNAQVTVYNSSNILEFNSTTTTPLYFDNSLVGYWTMDYSNSTGIFDNSTFNNFGTFTGTNIGQSNLTSGKILNGINLDGYGDYISVADSTNLDIGTNNLTFSAWVKFDNRTGQQIIGRHGGGYSTGVPGWSITTSNGVPLIQFGSSSQVYYNGGIAGATTLSPNVWYHVTGTFNRQGNFTWYLNGVQNGNQINISNSSGVDINPNSVLYLGYSSIFTINGSLDEVMMFNRSLSATEVQELYSQQLNIVNAGKIVPTPITEYTNYGGTRVYTSNYMINASIGSLVSNQLSRNITTNWLTDYLQISLGFSLDITSPLNNSVFNYSNIQLNFTNSSALSFCKWWINDSVNNTINCNNQTINLSDENYNLTLWANDSSGNSNQSVVNFLIDTVKPAILIDYPSNTTYNSSVVELNYTLTETNYDKCWYSGNLGLTNSSSVNAGTNFTITSTESSNNFRVYCNDTAGNENSTNVYFVVDTTAPQITIISPTASQILTSSTVTFSINTNENSTCNYSLNAGTDNYTLTANASGTGHTASRSLPDANYAVNYYCSDLIGNQNNSNNVSFSVAVPVEIPATSGGTGGGGGGGAPIYKPTVGFSTSIDSYETSISLNRIEFGEFTITNNGDLTEEYSINVQTIGDIISFEENKISIDPKNSKTIEFKVSSPKESGIYAGKIIISVGSKKKEILVSINVKTEKNLFDITLLIPKSSKTISLGSNLQAQINLLEMGLKENIDVTLDYTIKDFEGNVYLTESETIAVYDQKTIEKEFHTEELQSGNYVLGAELIYPDGVAVASSHFQVKEKTLSSNKLLIYIILGVILVIFSALIIGTRKYRNMTRKLEKLDK